MRPDFPAGTVTFLFTDIEGSTRLLHSLGPDAYADALAEHRRALRDAFVAQGGVEVDSRVTRALTLSNVAAIALDEDDDRQTVP